MDVELAQRAATALLNLALAVAVGVGATGLWLAPLASGWAAPQRRRLLLGLAKPAGDRHDCAAYLKSLSRSATIALGGIFATGMFSAWHNGGSAGALTGSAYGLTLIVKITLVLAAAMLGGFNRFFVMPKLIASLADGRQFTLILRVEAAVLLGALTLAAILSSTPPPAA
jgi:putative copper resistance protein D